MFEARFVTHSQASELTLSEVIRLKSSAWSYSYKDQMSWIDAHIRDSDLHCILSEDGVNVGYLNLVERNITIDDLNYKAYGVGNVCSFVKEKGYGRLLMKFANDFILDKGWIGLLLCKPELVHFYNKSGWELVPRLKLFCNFSSSNIEIMTYNCNVAYKRVVYNGDSF